MTGLTLAQRGQLTRDARMVDNARELAERLAVLKGGPGYLARYHWLAGEEHMSVVPASVTRTLMFALRA